MITIIGSGRVGSSAALRVAEKNLDEVLLVDIVKGLAKGEALDISQSCTFDVKLTGSDDYADIKDSDIVINTAGIARSPGMDRLDLMRKNWEITAHVAGKIKEFAPDSIVIQVANPIDMMALVQLKETGFKREKVIGMGGGLDSQRFRYFISKRFSVPTSEVEAMVIGEHGDSMVPIVSKAKVNGRPLSDMGSAEDIRGIVESTRKAGMEVIDLKGSTFYAPSAAIAALVESIVKDTKAIHPTSVYLKGEYGASGIFSGVPARIGKDGMEGVVELDITEKELQEFSDSCGVLRGKAKELGLL